MDKQLPAASGYASIDEKLAISSARHPGFPRDQAMLARLVKLVHKLFCDHGNALLRDYGISHPEYNVLMMLDGSEAGLSPSQISEAASEKSSNVTRLIDQLLAKGLVSREPSGEDRRKLVVRLTAAGEQLIETVMPAVIAQLQRFFSGVEAQELQQMEALLTRVLVGLETRA
ncbi:MarR family transcriptional regulator [Stenotrophomonas pictorum JCM 9942]|uniref:MarR family transcriptional regulator n=1 Tax=Stenotrophomonas pictorum JCM 9942 TaxID=1236960 RepID=A0A0R0AHE6_9GAMM|nr:MarR family transcriptional regulator [Stenotrophomonas pictorum]KRG44571.1 MarR family transcriptional regulator [Stenotrophomonas pictorum JCM 9942]